MIHDKCLPMFVLAKACNTTVYVHKNKSPRMISGDKNYEEVFIRMKSNI
jgi:hypothetical protein